MLDLTLVATERGVTERRFELTVGSERVPGLLWTPEDARGPRPLVLIGHGGTQHKRVENVLSLARRLVRHHGYAAAAIDAPGHGERLDPADAERQRATRSALQRGQGTPPSPERMRLIVERGEQVSREWRAALDALAPSPGIEGGPVGYWGLSMGTLFGVPFVASEARIKCAVLGLAGLRAGADAFERAAQAIRIPLLFVFQLDDELMPLDAGLALYKAFGARTKTMHLNPGRHVATPAFERDEYEAFFVRYLGRVGAEA